MFKVETLKLYQNEKSVSGRLARCERRSVDTDDFAVMGVT